MAKRGVHSERHAVQRHMRKEEEQSFERPDFREAAPTAKTFAEIAILREREFRLLEAKNARRWDTEPGDAAAGPKLHTPKRKDAGSDAWIDVVVQDTMGLEQGELNVRHPDRIGVSALPEPRSIYANVSSRFGSIDKGSAGPGKILEPQPYTYSRKGFGPWKQRG